MSNVSLTLQPVEKSLKNALFYEPIDTEVLDKLIRSDLLVPQWEQEGSLFNNEREQLVSYSKIVKNGKAEVKYVMPEGVDFGRVAPFKNLGLATIRRQIRHTLTKGRFVDIDIENAHPTILYQISKQYSIQCVNLEDYVKNRKKHLLNVMDTYNVSRDVAKNLYIRLLYFGTFDSWAEDNLINKEPTKEIQNFKNELMTIGKIICSNNRSISDQIRERKIKKNIHKYNKYGSVVSYYLQEIERRILETMYSYALENGYIKDKVAVLCADGIMIQQELYRPELLEELSQVIKEKFNLQLKFTTKPLDEDYLSILDEHIVAPKKTYPTYEELKKELEKDDGLFYCRTDQKFYLKMRKDGLTFYNPHSQTNLAIALADKKILDIKPTGATQLVPWVNKWCEDENRRIIDEFIYNMDPNYVVKDNEVNLWEGFLIEKSESDLSEEEEQNITETLDKYFSALGNGNEQMKTYLINWIAHLIQKPHDYLVTVPYLQSNDGGTGKSTYVKLIGAILGSDKYIHTAYGFSELNTQYNDHLRDCVVYGAEELQYEDGKKNSDYVKAHTSQKTLTINPKYGSKVVIPNKVRIVITTNGLNTIPVEQGQRRLVITKVNNSLKNNTKFWNDMYGIMGDKMKCRYIYDKLKSIDLSQWNPNNIPETELMTSLKEVNKPLIEVWIEEDAKKLYSMDDDKIFFKEILTKFNKWAENGDYKVKYNGQKFGLIVKNNDLFNKVFIDKKRDEDGYFYGIDKVFIKEQYELTDSDELLID